MGKKILLRSFEDRDVDFIYKSKHSRRINQTIIGEYNNFSYDDAIEWVNGCTKQDANYKFWAICTADEFQNIVGWCSISNIDYHNKKASLHGITINDNDYNDGLTCFEVFSLLADYVFDVLKFNRFYTMCIVSNKFTMTIGKIFFECTEGVLKQAICKNGQYYDLSIYAILRDEYFEYKSKGELKPEVLWEKFKNALKTESESFFSKEEFVKSFLYTINYSGSQNISPETKFRELDWWSSLYAIEFIAALEEQFNIKLSASDLIKCETFSDVYDHVKEKTQKSNGSVLNTIEFSDNHSEPF